MTGPGKRWRPIYAMTIAKLLNVDFENDKEAMGIIMDISSMVEVFHIAQLVLDDISDGSLVRRDVPCVHIAYSMGTGVNVGLNCTYQPYRRFFELRPEIAQNAAYDYVEAMCNLFKGQCMKEYKRDDGLKMEFYNDSESLTAGSTAKFVLKTIFKNFGGDADILERLILIHDKMWNLHQVKDDIANIQPVQIALSKGLVGEDISVGKYTPMIIYSLANADKPRADRLREILLSGTRDQAILNEAIDILVKTGGVEHANNIMNNLYREITEEINDLKKSVNPNKYSMLGFDQLQGYAYQLTTIEK